jgi:hypothetical protein
MWERRRNSCLQTNRQVKQAHVLTLRQKERGSTSYCGYIRTLIDSEPIPLATRSKEGVCGRSLAGIAGSNSAEGMDVCLL